MPVRNSRRSICAVAGISHDCAAFDKALLQANHANGTWSFALLDMLHFIAASLALKASGAHISCTALRVVHVVSYHQPPKI